MTTRALLVIDVQHDFLPDGALPAPGGDDVVPVANDLMERFDLVVASQDWHPPDHGSFASNHEGHDVGEVIEFNGLDQILWPDHCIQGSEGAEFADALETERIDHVVRKGTDPEIDSYSAFYDNDHRRATGLDDYLTERGVDEVVLVGLATDYCVKFTALDACELGYETWVVVDGCRGVENQPGDIDAAFTDMREAGARLTDSGALNARLFD
jgi:nicotinamidase/pyrazinamidase